MTEKNTQSSRRLKYGANFILLTAIALASAGGLAYITSQYSQRADISSAQVNSLSQRTKKLLEQVDTKGDKFELVSTYLGGTIDASGRDRAQQVDDLLSNYARVSKNVKVGTRDGLDTRIRDRYAAEFKQYEETASGYSKIFDDLEKFCKEEGANLGALSQQKGLSRSAQNEILSIQGLFNETIPEILKKSREKIRKSTDSTVPAWSPIVEELKSKTGDLSNALKQFLGDAAGQLSPTLQAYIKKQSGEYQKITTELDEFKGKLDKLPALKSDSVFSSLRENCIVVLGPQDAKVLSNYDVYKSPRSADDMSDNTQMKFEGEQAISTALLGMTQPNKHKVVFIGGQTGMITGQYSSFADILNRANFEVLEWAPPSPQRGPQQQPQSPEPPAEGKGVTFVVMTPDVNPQMAMMGMPPTSPQPIIDAVKKHLDDGGSALFLAEASSPFAAMMGGSGGYPYDPLVKPFGIEVNAKYTVMQAFPSRDGKTQAVPQFTINRYPDTPVTGPLQTLDTIFAGQITRMGAMGGPTPVSVIVDKPADVKDFILALTETSDTIWAESNPNIDSKFNPETDLKSPISLAVASEKGSGDKAQRVIVLGNKIMATNEAIESARVVQRGNAVVAVANFPGNGELLLNSVYWLSNYDTMIAVSPQASAAMRIKAMSPGAETAVRTAAMLVPPVLAIIAGAVVFFVRRKS